MLDTTRRVATPEGIELTLRLAGPVPRALAWSVDLALRVIVVLVVMMVASQLGRAGWGVVLLAAFFVEWILPALFEAQMGGQTPGKRFFGIAVLNDDGTLRPVEKPRARWPAVAASTLLTALIAAGLWWWITPPVVEEKPPVSVLVADFENRTGDPVFDGVVEQALGLGIESASFVTQYPRRDALRVAAGIKPGATLDEQTARLVALPEGEQGLAVTDEDRRILWLAAGHGETQHLGEKVYGCRQGVDSQTDMVNPGRHSLGQGLADILAHRHLLK